MADERKVSVNVDFWGGFFGVVVLFFLLTSDKCGSGVHWTYDGQPHSFMLADGPKKP